jgi:hypothetical protein
LGQAITDRLNVHPEGAATDHLGTGFLGFLLLSGK